MYIIRMTEHEPTGLFAPGSCSSNWQSRVAEIAGGLPKESNIALVYKVPEMYEMERMLHEQFRKKRLNGEWFRLDVVDILDLMTSLRSEQIVAPEGMRERAAAAREGMMLAYGLPADWMPQWERELGAKSGERLPA